jgi:alpha-tubulin suppressor-like RCC1 family protein
MEHKPWRILHPHASATGCRHSTSKPAVIRALEHINIVQVAAGGWHCLAVSEDGKIYAWGGNEYFQCGVDAGVHPWRSRVQTSALFVAENLQNLVCLLRSYMCACLLCKV